MQIDEVRCRICNEVKKRGKFLVLKFDELQKHASCYKVTFACLGVVVN